MPQILQRLNPFDPRDVICESVEAGNTIQEWFEDRGEFELPTVCLLNGHAVLRAEWPKRTLAANDHVEFKSYPAGVDPLTLAITAAVAVGASLAVSALLPKPDTDTSGFDQSPTYNLEAQSNRARLYQPIPDHYGRVRCYPDLAAQPYREFGFNNEEILYQLFLVGHGEYEYEALKVEDTDASNFDQISSQFIGPGETVTLFPDNVETSVEVGDINLDDTTYRGGFVANQADTLADALAFDFVCPNGVYRSKKSGSLRQWTQLVVQMECRKVDDQGDPEGSGVWTVLGSEMITAVNRDAQRRTFRYNVPVGRYEARVRRVNTPSADALIQDDCHWVGLKAYITGLQNYGDVSLIAVRANATADLSAKSQFRFNIVATRKLSTYNGSVWGAPVATTDLAPAIRELLTADHGGSKQDSEIDLDRLQELDATWKGHGVEFNYRFDRLGNLWKNLSVMLRAGRGSPILEGSIVSFARHQAQALPTALFTPDNIIAGSFSIDDSFPDEETEDHIIVEYFDETTWRREDVLCVLSGSTQLRPKRIQLNGITSRQQAFNEGMYEAAKLKNMTTSVKFSTELEGMIPQFMELIAIGHDLPGWGQGGHLTDVAGTTFTLSQDADFSAGGNHYIGFRKPNGELAGPFLATAGAEANQVVVTDALGFTPVFDEARMPTMYQFGPSNNFEAHAVVVDVSPSGNDRVTITALLESSTVHQHFGTAPAINYYHALEKDPLEPVVSGLRVIESEVDRDTAIATWNQAAGAEVYILQKSTDGGVTWLSAGMTSGTRQSIVLESGQFLLRVAGRGAVRGPWDQITVQLTAQPRTDYTADIYHQLDEPAGANLDIGDIWIKLDGDTGQAVNGYQYLEKAPGTWADPAVPEYEWVINDTNHAMIVSLINAHNSSLTSTWGGIVDADPINNPKPQAGASGTFSGEKPDWYDGVFWIETATGDIYRSENSYSDLEDPDGEIVEDPDGEPFYSTGTFIKVGSLDVTRLNNAELVLNEALSILDNGTLVGGSGGQVTIVGLGFNGSLDATDNTITSGAVTPSNETGVDNNLFFNTTEQAWYAKIGGAWQKVSDTTAGNIALGIVNQGDLAVLNSADWSTQVGGAGKPQDNATRNDGPLLSDGFEISSNITADKLPINNWIKVRDGLTPVTLLGNQSFEFEAAGAYQLNLTLSMSFDLDTHSFAIPPTVTFQLYTRYSADGVTYDPPDNYQYIDRVRPYSTTSTTVTAFGSLSLSITVDAAAGSEMQVYFNAVNASGFAVNNCKVDILQLKQVPNS